MGFLMNGIPTQEEKRKRSRLAEAFAGFFRRPGDKESTAPDVSTDKGAGYKPRPEMWRYPQRKDGTRREGTYFRPTPRDRFGRFSKAFDLKKFKETQDQINAR